MLGGQLMTFAVFCVVVALRAFERKKRLIRYQLFVGVVRGTKSREETVTDIFEAGSGILITFYHLPLQPKFMHCDTCQL